MTDSPESANELRSHNAAGPDTSPALARVKLGPVAPAWHSVILVLALLVFSLGGVHSQHKFSAEHGPAALYLVTIVWEWLMLAYIAWGVRRQHVTLTDLIGGRWRSFSDLLADILIAWLFWAAAAAVLAAIGYAMGLANPRDVSEMRERIGFIVPRTTLELALFLALSATAGFCEEIIFRGYFLRQFSALFKSLWAGLLLQAALFGAGHGYEGGKRMVLIAIYGLMFALLALARRSLRPGMLAHALQDSISGILMRALR
jgi:membrane protease YdiL (CAAX protease family)